MEKKFVQTEHKKDSSSHPLINNNILEFFVLESTLDACQCMCKIFCHGKFQILWQANENTNIRIPSGKNRSFMQMILIILRNQFLFPIFQVLCTLSSKRRGCEQSLPLAARLQNIALLQAKCFELKFYRIPNRFLLQIEFIFRLARIRKKVSKVCSPPSRLLVSNRISQT